MFTLMLIRFVVDLIIYLHVVVYWEQVVLIRARVGKPVATVFERNGRMINQEKIILLNDFCF